jgi:hypothetical protein
MKTRLTLLAAVVVLIGTLPIEATRTPNQVERLQYSWRLEGGLSWLAGLAFPTSGRGVLENVNDGRLNSRLNLGANNQSGRIYYESIMSADASRTYNSADGYAWRSRWQDERVSYDHQRRSAHLVKRNDKGEETRTLPVETASPRDVLTSIHFLRLNASKITSPQRLDVYSDGKPYPFLFTPHPVTTIQIGREQHTVRPFSMTPIGDRRGTVRVWLSEDAHRVPVRILIEQKYGRLRLDLQR